MTLRELLLANKKKLRLPLWEPGYYCKLRKVDGNWVGEIYTPEGALTVGRGVEETLRIDANTKLAMIESWLPYED